MSFVVHRNYEQRSTQWTIMEKKRDLYIKDKENKTNKIDFYTTLSELNSMFSTRKPLISYKFNEDTNEIYPVYDDSEVVSKILSQILSEEINLIKKFKDEKKKYEETQILYKNIRNLKVQFNMFMNEWKNEIDGLYKKLIDQETVKDYDVAEKEKLKNSIKEIKEWARINPFIVSAKQVTDFDENVKDFMNPFNWQDSDYNKDYKTKYLKYKSKYVNLKDQYNM